MRSRVVRDKEPLTKRLQFPRRSNLVLLPRCHDSEYSERKVRNETVKLPMKLKKSRSGNTYETVIHKELSEASPAPRPLISVSKGTLISNNGRVHSERATAVTIAYNVSGKQGTS